MSLGEKRCVPCEGGVPALDSEQITALSKQLPDWRAAPDGVSLERTFRFASYHQVMAFVNAVAWVAHREDHHPDLAVHYDHVVVRYSTHAIGGLSENDFICAAKVSALI
ncbi:MAG: 4a-hydroxytetrahydrobiopterin dehydratase [Myxococcales bacterium]|nr:4a-hydroxytetrahydrobiopterin dehydratase [Myxococcales bacterium]